MHRLKAIERAQQQFDIQFEIEPDVCMPEPQPRFQLPEHPPLKPTYTVQQGDTMRDISKRLLGNETRWKEIFELNKDEIRDPDLIFPKQVFDLPEIGYEPPGGPPPNYEPPGGPPPSYGPPGH